MKNILGLLLLIVLGTSCSVGYGCPNSITETSTSTPAKKTVYEFDGDAVEHLAVVSVVCQE